MRKKRFLSWALMLAVFFSMFIGMQATVWAETPASDFTFDKSTGTITKYSGSGGVVDIPSSIDEVAVKAIGNRAFAENGAGKLTEVSIPSSVETIGESAFENCGKLQYVKLNEGLKVISKSAFYKCYNIESIVIPSSVTSIGDNAFSGPTDSSSFKTYLKQAVFLGATAPSIGSQVFYNAADDFKIFYPNGGSGYSDAWNTYTSNTYDPSATYTFTYDANGADSGNTPSQTTGLKTGDYIELPGQGNLVKANCRFDGWNTTADGKGQTLITPKRIVICNSNITLYAKWTSAYKINIDSAVQNGTITSKVWNNDINQGISATEAGVGEQVLVDVMPDNGYHLKAGSLKYNDGSKDNDITEQGESGLAFDMPASDVTIKAIFEKDAIPGGPVIIDLSTVSSGGTGYTCEAITVNKLTEYVVTITKAGDYELTGTSTQISTINPAAHSVHVVVSETANITLNNAKISIVNFSPLAISPGKVVNLTLADGTQNTLSVGGSELGIAGLYVPAGASVIINGTGKLNADGGGGGAGTGNGAAIGGMSYKSFDSDAGNITVNSGEINATGGVNAAAIGGGYSGGVSKVTINGGTITANSNSSYTDAIGAGYDYVGKLPANSVIIAGGSVMANHWAHTTPTNGSTGVCLATVTVQGNDGSKLTNTEVSCKGGANTFTTKTDENGKLYLWLPEGNNSKVTITSSGIDYIATGNIKNNTVNNFIAVPVTVTKVNVTPKTANVQKGTTKTFSAEVLGTNNPAQTVKWNVTGGVAGTTIDSSGKLTVDPNETANELKVKATSGQDSSKSGEAIVTVATEPVVCLQIGDSKYGAWSDATAAVKVGETITLLEDVTLEKSDTMPTVACTIYGGTSKHKLTLNGQTLKTDTALKDLNLGFAGNGQFIFNCSGHSLNISGTVEAKNDVSIVNGSQLDINGTVKLGEYGGVSGFTNLSLSAQASISASSLDAISASIDGTVTCKYFNVGKSSGTSGVLSGTGRFIFTQGGGKSGNISITNTVINKNAKFTLYALGFTPVEGERVVNAPDGCLDRFVLGNGYPGFKLVFQNSSGYDTYVLKKLKQLKTPSVILAPDTVKGGLTYTITPASGETGTVSEYEMQILAGDGTTELGIVITSTVTSGNIPLSSEILSGSSYCASVRAVSVTGSDYLSSNYSTACTAAKAASIPGNTNPGNGGGNGGGNSGNSGGTTPGNNQITPPTTTTDNSSGVTTTTTEAKSDSAGKAAAAVTESQITDALKKSDEAASKKGQKTEPKVEIKVQAPVDSKSVETSLPKTALNAVAASNTAGLTVSTPVAAITFDDKALDTISGQADGDVKITTAKADVSTLSEETRQAVGDRPVYNFSVTSGDKTISQFGGSVTVAVPYTPKPGEDPNAIVIYYINAQGKPEMVSNCKYDPVTGSVSFTTNHFSQYAVGYNKTSFKDVSEDAWYSKAVGFIAARGITSGTGNGQFSPEEKLTRGQFIVMVLRAYGINPDQNPAENFADAGNTYYTNYLTAAKRLGISGGVGNNRFAPDNQITRQEMFVLLYNALKATGNVPEVTGTKTLSEFNDAGQVASWAKDAMIFFAESGKISGNGGKLSPVSTTSRAEMAQVLYNLLSK